VVGVPHIFLAKPGMAAVLYTRPLYLRERHIAFGGPLAAALVCGLTVLCIHSLPVCCTAAATAFIHLYSLLPWAADGKTLWSKL
jgi:hypothetical protein